LKEGEVRGERNNLGRRHRIRAAVAKEGKRERKGGKEWQKRSKVKGTKNMKEARVCCE
jgi:hypothetical protein